MSEQQETHPAPRTGPDYRHINSRAKAEDLHQRGELHKLLLLPAEFGGQDIAANVVYVPGFVVEMKARIDLGTIMPLARSGDITRYTATPEYEGDSFIPSRILITAKDPKEINLSIAIWGDAVQREPATGAPAAPPAFEPVGIAAELHDPAAYVQAYIADFERWNQFASAASDADWEAGMDAADAAYQALMERYCPPGHPAQPISFGSESNHTVENEAVTAVEITGETSGDTCVVKTRHGKRLTPTFVSNSDYEYHLKKTGQRWFLVSLLYVDDEGRYECL